LKFLLPLVLSLFLLTQGSCAHSPTPAVNATCAMVCVHGAELSCDYAKPTLGGATCEQVCQNAANAGEPWRLSCLEQTTTCDPLACP
jgi:hypothetical protein